MKQYTYHAELMTIVKHFIGAFNDIIVKGYDHEGTLIPNSNKIVRFVYAPKQKVIESLITPAPGGVSVPVISVSVGNIARDKNRVFNKNNGFSIPFNTPEDDSVFLKQIRQPIPVNISINMSIMTKYQEHLDQIITNFVPYCDPYIVISWRFPGLEGSDSQFEIRSKVLWDGSIRTTYPTELSNSQSFRVTADTTFTIEGWMFKHSEEQYKKIYYIDAAFNSVDDSSYSLLETLPEFDTETISFSARPFVKSVYPYALVSWEIEDDPLQFELGGQILDPLHFEIYGKYLLSIRNVYLIPSMSNMLTGCVLHNPFSAVPNLSALYPAFSGLKLSEFNVLTDETLEFDIPHYPLTDGNIDILVENEAGYGRLTRDSLRANIKSWSGWLLEHPPYYKGIQVYRPLLSNYIFDGLDDILVDEHLNTVVWDGEGIKKSSFSSPAAVHLHRHLNFWSDDIELIDGSILYVDQFSNALAKNVSFVIEGVRYSTNGAGVVTKSYVYNHPYQHGDYWSDDQTLINGSILYTGRHTNQRVSNVTFVLGDFTVVVNYAGVVSINYTYNHPYVHNTNYWSDDQVLVVGSKLYTGRYNNTPASNLNFTLSLSNNRQYNVITNSSGVVTSITAVDHPYQHGNYWSDSETLVVGSRIFLNRYRYDTYSASFELNGFVYVAGFNGVITSITAINHQYQHNVYWADVETLVNGSILYTGQYTNTKAINISFVSGDNTISTDSNGIVTIVLTSSINHPYQHGNYWSDDQTLVNGSILYNGQNSNIRAASVTFVLGEYTVTTDGNGVVTLTYTINHPHQHGDYWSDDQTLSNGSILYTGQHSNVKAVNVSFVLGDYNVTTNANGVVTLTLNLVIIGGLPGRDVDLGDYDGYVTTGFPLTALFDKMAGFLPESITIIKSALDHWSNILRYTILPPQTLPSEMYDGSWWADNPLVGNPSRGYLVCINRLSTGNTNLLAAASYSYLRRDQKDENTPHYLLPSVGFFYINEPFELPMIQNVTPGGKSELYNTVIHEMGHAFGLGTSWYRKLNTELERSFMVNAGDMSPNPVNGTLANVFYAIDRGDNSRTSSQPGTLIRGRGDASYTYAYNPKSSKGNVSVAVSAYNIVYNNTLSAIPLENGMTAGSYGSHWHEGLESFSANSTGDVRQYYGSTYPGAPALRDEMMTPQSEGKYDVPLSIVSLGAMEDLGWTVDYSLADNYEPLLIKVKRSTTQDALTYKRNNFGGYIEVRKGNYFDIFYSIRRGLTYTINNETGYNLELRAFNNAVGAPITTNVTNVTINGVPSIVWTVPTNLPENSLVCLYGTRPMDLIIINIS
jgi:hypothetical protein